MKPVHTSRVIAHVEILFRPLQSRLAEEYRHELRLAQHKARKTNNGGAMIPAEAESYIKEIRAHSVARARCLVEAYTAFGIPADADAERDLVEYHSMLVSVRKAVFITEEELTAQRTNRPVSSQLSYAARGFEAGASIALEEGRKLLAQQRVSMENKMQPSAIALNAPTHIPDTCIFNWLADGKIKSEDLPVGARFAITHIQLDEINNTKNSERRARLLIAQAVLHPQLVLTETLVWDVSRWDLAKWGTRGLYEKLRAEMDSLNGAKPNNVHDALIAETAIANGYVLVTADNDLRKVSENNGAKVLFFSIEKH